MNSGLKIKNNAKSILAPKEIFISLRIPSQIMRVSVSITILGIFTRRFIVSSPVGFLNWEMKGAVRLVNVR
jgi:hypothetical protein